MSKAELTILFDGLCPICAREIAFMRRRDRHGRLGFIDIAAAEFDPQDWGLSTPQAIARIHAFDAQGRMLEGMEVFRRAYGLIGLGWIVAWSGWPLLRPIADLGYRLFARIRPRFSSLECGERCAAERGAAQRKLEHISE